MDWIFLALGAALATSLTTIFSKLGLKGVNSNFATLVKTFIVVIFSLLLCLFTGALPSIQSFTIENYVFLVLSGISTGLSWLCYFKALKLANVNKVVPIDKSSFILTNILFLIFFFDSTTHNGDLGTIFALIGSMMLMLGGTLLMVINKQENEEKANKLWILFAILSAAFASLVALFGKFGLTNINSNLATLFKTIIVLLFSLAIVLVKKDYKGVKEITWKNWLFLILAGLATGGAWLLEFAAYSIEGGNAIAINSIGKLSILLTMLFSFIFLKEKFTIKTLIGLTLLTGGIVLAIVFSL